jgi:hypothetical protein
LLGERRRGGEEGSDKDQGFHFRSSFIEHERSRQPAARAGSRLRSLAFQVFFPTIAEFCLKFLIGCS